MAHYHLGLPAWAFAGWNNIYFTSKPSALASYASVFNTVEGNTTFYHIPDEASVDSWYQSVLNTNFRFCFKLPKTITHQNRPNFADLDLFFKRIQPLQNNCGPVLLQFPSTVGPGDLSRIESIVAKIPPDYRIALEVRHEDFFSQPQHLEPLLAQYHLGRVIMDTRPVFEGNRDHPKYWRHCIKNQICRYQARYTTVYCLYVCYCIRIYTAMMHTWSNGYREQRGL